MPPYSGLGVYGGIIGGWGSSGGRSVYAKRTIASAPTTRQ
jgi:hypothetical protein